jgi:hypothetical protein
MTQGIVTGDRAGAPMKYGSMDLPKRGLMIVWKLYNGASSGINDITRKCESKTSDSFREQMMNIEI